MTRTLGILLSALIGLGSLSAYAIPNVTDSDAAIASEAKQFKKHLNSYFPDLNVQIKDDGASATEVMGDLEALEDFLHGDKSVVGPLKRLACDKCVCTGCYSK